MSGQTLHLRAPVRGDGSKIWRLAGSCGLDANSPYMYLLWCRDFADTSVIAEVDGAVAGFVIGYRRPAEPTTLFVWQVGVSKAFRRRGLALEMLTDLRDRIAPGLRYIEASVTPSNRASASLFQSLAVSSGVEIRSTALFDAPMFPGDRPHEAELLLRIGPFASDGSTCDLSMGAGRTVLA